MSDYRHILIATDLSVDCEALLDRAKRLMTDTTKLSLIHAVRPLDTTYFGAMPYVPVIIDGVEVENRIVESRTEKFAEFIAKNKLDKAIWRIEIGKPTKVIKDYAEENLCDLIILGSHGEKGVRALLGSTATGVLNDAPCDVLAIRVYS